MYCPQCLTEYRDGFFECADCRVPLAPGPPPEPLPGLPPVPRVPLPLELVTILETEDSFALSLAKASLEEAGIPYLVSGEEPMLIHHIMGSPTMPLGTYHCQIQVSREDEREARELVEPLQHPDPGAGSGQ